MSNPLEGNPAKVLKPMLRQPHLHQASVGFTFDKHIQRAWNTIAEALHVGFVERIEVGSDTWGEMVNMASTDLMNSGHVHSWTKSSKMLKDALCLMQLLGYMTMKNDGTWVAAYEVQVPLFSVAYDAYFRPVPQTVADGVPEFFVEKID